MTNTILITPPELRSKAEQLRSHAQVVFQAVENSDQVIGPLNADHFTGVRADALRQRYYSQRETMFSMSNLVLSFATVLETAANIFERADLQGQVLGKSERADLQGQVLGTSSDILDYSQMPWSAKLQELQILRQKIKALQDQITAGEPIDALDQKIRDLDAQITELEEKRATVQGYANNFFNNILPDQFPPQANDEDGFPLWRTRSDDHEDEISAYDEQLILLNQQRDQLNQQREATLSQIREVEELQNRQDRLGVVIQDGIIKDGPSPKYPYFEGQDNTNCTKYASGQRNLPVSGHAYQWDDQARAGGFETGSYPVKGSVMVFEPGQVDADAEFGHVAIVESVTDNGNGTYALRISENAWGGVSNMGTHHERDLIIGVNENGQVLYNGNPVQVSFIYEQIK